MSILLLSGFAAITSGVWIFQNKGERLGGRISFVKAGWLAYAITLWIGLPLILCGEGSAFVVLLVSMGVRAAFEIPLCLSGRWRVAYGVGHDLLHFALVLWFRHELGVWAWPTLVSLITELVFVYWFVRVTSGPCNGVFFVPGGAEYRRINRWTAVLFFPQLIWFIVLLILS